MESLSEDKARHHYIQVKGSRKPLHEGTPSVCVREHVDVFFDHIFPSLQEYFKEKISENVMIICAYGASVSHPPTVACACA